MKYNFQLPNFPNSNFEIEISMLTGKSQLFKDGFQIEQSTEKGKPFLIPGLNNDVIKAYPKNSFPDFAPTLEINGEKHDIAEKLKWYQYALGALPIVLLFVGGAIGGGIGAFGMITNFSIFRNKETSEASKYLKVIGVNIGCYLLFDLGAYIFHEMISK